VVNESKQLIIELSDAKLQQLLRYGHEGAALVNVFEQSSVVVPSLETTLFAPTLPITQILRSLGARLSTLTETYEVVIAINPNLFDSFASSVEAFAENFSNKVNKVSEGKVRHRIEFFKGDTELEALKAQYPNAMIAVIDSRNKLETPNGSSFDAHLNLGLVSVDKGSEERMINVGLVLTFFTILMIEKAKAKRQGVSFNARDFLENDLIARQLFKNITSQLIHTVQ